MLQTYNKNILNLIYIYMADYRKKYLKYKKKYLELKTQLGGAPIFPWLPIKSKQLHIQAVIDPD